MTDYSKLKVTDLKAELKRRGVPQTGLRLKQDFIDKLLELDAVTEGADIAADGEPAKDTKEEESGGRVEGEDPAPVQPPESEPEQTNNTTQSQQGGTAEVAEQSQSSEEAAPVKENVVDTQPEEKAVDDQAAPQPKEQLISEPPEEESKPAGEDVTETQTSEIKETAAVSQPPAEATTNHEPSMYTVSEVIDDMRKRKRRSQSPPPSAETLKKAKSDNEHPRVILKEDVGAENIPQRYAGLNDHQPPTQDNSTPDPAEAAAESELPESKMDVEADGEAGRISLSQAEGNKGPAPAARQDPRFKGLFSPTEERHRPASPGLVAGMGEDDDRQVEPALHPASSAIYIRNFMRPLQPGTLKSHLVSLATPSGATPNPDIILDFFLDSIKTHGFVQFANVSAASRVRSALHGAVWPNERDRKPLWVDFIPEDKLREWIGIEQESEPRGRGGPRWEVVYEQTEDGVKAVLQESRTVTTAPAPSRGRDAGHTAPTAPRGPRRSVDMGPRRGSQASGASRPRGGEGFQALDERFLSTKTKPKLYYLPVPKDVAEKRLDQFASLAKNGPRPRRGGDDMRRITFEDEDMFVDKGPEYGGPPARGGRGRGRGGRPWRGRGY
jgi:chemotaxis protein histidine kinase CheA